MTRKSLEKLLIVLLLSLPAGACGVKPDSVAPPAGAEEIQFPRSYPTSIEE